MFDILASSALDISNGLIKEAWGGVLPQGGNDFPSGCILSKCNPQDSQISVKIGTHPKANSYSAVPMLADRTRSIVIGPSDTDTPFLYSAGEITPPGIFGKALKAYGQVIALARKYGVNEKPYDNWFRVQWGVAPDTDLTGIIPALRSENDALWGGMGRKLAPGALLHSAGTKQTNVEFHNYSRQNAGEHKLVDYPRLRAIASIAGSFIMLEDRHAAGKLKRIDFRVVSKEIPVSPANISLNLQNIIMVDNWNIRDVCRGALEHVQGFRKVALILARNSLGTSGALELDDNYHVPAEAILDFISQNKVPSIPYTTNMTMSEPVFDLADYAPPPKIDMQNDNDNGRVMTTYIAFASVIRPFVNKHFHTLPLAWQIRDDLLNMNFGVGKDMEAAEKRIRKVIAEVVPPDWLKRLYRLYCLVFKDKQQARNLMVKVMKDMNAPNGVFQNTDWMIAGPRIIATKACFPWIGEEISRSITRTVRERGSEAKLVGNLRRILSNSMNGDLGLAEIVRQRKNWWASEYIRRAKANEDKRVLYQQKSRLFKHSQLSIDERGNVTHKENQPALCNVLEASARNFLRKRRTKRNSADNPITPVNDRPKDYAMRLDTLYNPKVKWCDIWDDYLRSIRMLIVDIEEILKYIGHDMNEDFGRMRGDLEEEVVDDDAEIDVDVEVDEPVSNDKGKAVAPLDVNEFDDLFGDDDVEGNIGESSGNLIDLAGELKEDVMDLREDVMIEQLNVYGGSVPVELYETILNEAREKNLERIRDKIPGKTLDPVLPDYDVTDRYR